MSNAAIQLLVPDPPVCTSVSSTSNSTTTGASASINDVISSASGLLLDVTAEALAHCRQHLVGKVVESPRGEARVQRRREYRNRNAFVNRGDRRPSPFAGVQDPPSVLSQIGRIEKCGDRKSVV